MLRVPYKIVWDRTAPDTDPSPVEEVRLGERVLYVSEHAKVELSLPILRVSVPKPFLIQSSQCGS